MIKGEIHISEAAVNLHPLQLHQNVENNLSEETKINNSIAEELSIDELDIKIYFARMKRRKRCRSSNIL